MTGRFVAAAVLDAGQIGVVAVVAIQTMTVMGLLARDGDHVNGRHEMVLVAAALTGKGLAMPIDQSVVKVLFVDG
jgi:hypothetical protein